MSNLSNLIYYQRRGKCKKKKKKKKKCSDSIPHIIWVIYSVSIPDWFGTVKMELDFL